MTEESPELISTDLLVLASPFIDQNWLMNNVVRLRHIYLPDAPTADTEAVNKEYADDTFLPIVFSYTRSLWLDAGGVRAPGSKPAAFVESGITGVWQFGDEATANQESVSGTLRIPDDMDRDTVPTFKIGWSADGASPGNCYWQLEYLWVALGDDTTGAAQETLAITPAASATANGLVISAFSGIDLPATSDQALFFRITRISGDALDTIADTVEMRGRLFTYTMDKLGT